MSKILKNTTDSAIVIDDVGAIAIDASPGQYTIPPQDYDLWSASDDVVEPIGSTDLVVNDGSKDLTPSDGMELIDGIFPNPVGIDPEQNVVEIDPMSASSTSATVLLQCIITELQRANAHLSQITDMDNEGFEP